MPTITPTPRFTGGIAKVPDSLYPTTPHAPPSQPPMQNDGYNGGGIIPPHMQSGWKPHMMSATKMPAAAGGHAAASGVVGQQNGSRVAGVPRAPTPPMTLSKPAELVRSRQAAAATNGRPVLPTRGAAGGRPPGQDMGLMMRRPMRRY